MKKQKRCILIEKLLLDGWFKDENEATPFIMAGKVLVNNQPASNCNEKISIDSTIRVKEYYKMRYVSKGGLKLEGALKDLNIDVNNKVALDCGASTGGFTDCLISHGASKVYAVDVGYGQIAGKLLANKKVENMEKTNLSDPVLLKLDPIPEIITLDLSYLSLTKALPICDNIFRGYTGTVICLVKPLFEVESSEIRRTGKIGDKTIMQDILRTLCNNFIEQKMNIIGITNSPVTGNNGTLEYFIGVQLNSVEKQVCIENQVGFENIEKSIVEVVDRSFDIVRFNKYDFE